MRKAQRLSSIVRNQNNNSNQNQNQNSLDQNNPVLALNLMGSGGSAEVAKQPQQPVTGLSDMQLTLLQFLNLFPQLFPQQNLLQHNQKNWLIDLSIDFSQRISLHTVQWISFFNTGHGF